MWHIESHRYFSEQLPSTCPKMNVGKLWNQARSRGRYMDSWLGWIWKKNPSMPLLCTGWHWWVILYNFWSLKPIAKLFTEKKIQDKHLPSLSHLLRQALCPLGLFCLQPGHASCRSLKTYFSIGFFNSSPSISTWSPLRDPASHGHWLLPRERLSPSFLELLFHVFISGALVFWGWIRED